MNAAEKKRLLEYSAMAKPKRFRNWQRYEYRQKQASNGQLLFDPDGEAIMARVPVHPWPVDLVVDWLRRTDYRLARASAEQGWLLRLIDFVAKQHRIPGADELDMLVEHQQQIDKVNFSDAHKERRESIRQRLLANLELKTKG